LVKIISKKNIKKIKIIKKEEDDFGEKMKKKKRM